MTHVDGAQEEDAGIHSFRRINASHQAFIGTNDNTNAPFGIARSNAAGHLEVPGDGNLYNNWQGATDHQTPTGFAI